MIKGYDFIIIGGGVVGFVLVGCLFEFFDL